MPSIQHEGLVELICQYPPLGVELLRHAGVFALPAGVTAVLGSEDMSDVTPRSNGRRGRQPMPQKYLVLFNAVIGAVDLDTQEGRTQVVTAIGSTGTTGSYFRSLCDIVLGIASDAAHEHLEELMGITYKSKFVDGFYQQGRAAGAAEGKAQGEAVGEARARATGILRILKSRALHPTRAQRELIESCQDLSQLDAWFDRALAVTTAAAVFED